MSLRRTCLHALGVAAALVAPLAAGTAVAQSPGNVIFLHPDGTGANHWAAARMYWKGPDGTLNWDRLPQIAVYRGHMTELLTGTSNGGATVHAFGYKVEGLGSFGKDGNGNLVPPTDRAILALSGFGGSIMREAANRGNPVGVVNDGNVGEPGTGAFLAEVGNRDNWNAIALQMIAGRDGRAPVGASTDRPPVVILGGGERNFLPTGTPRCTAAQAGTFAQATGSVRTYPTTCMVHTLDWSKTGRNAAPDRTDGRNLLEEAVAAGYVVVRTRAEFQQVTTRLARDPHWRPRVLGLFAAHHTFNDRTEEELIATGFRNPEIAETAKASNLVLFGNPSSADPGFNPPRADELTRLALLVLNRHSLAARKPYLLVTEPESTDNFGNAQNAIGTLVATKIADDMIGVTLEALQSRGPSPFRSPFRTTVVTAADSDASGLQVAALLPAASVPNVGAVNVNFAPSPATRFDVPLDGLYGRNTRAFEAEPDQFGRKLTFGVAWAGSPDFAGGIVSRAATNRGRWEGDRFGSLDAFSERFDSTDVYRFMYFHLFGVELPPSTTEAPSR